MITVITYILRLIILRGNADDPAKLFPEIHADEIRFRSGKVGVINFIDGSDMGEVELTKKLTKIGKADNSEIKLAGMLMGATAATISRRPSGYAISFTGGLAKLKVNGEVVKESVPLKDFDTIEVGSHKFQFYEKEID